MQLRNGELEILSATLRGLVAVAYDQEDRRIAPTPKWMAEDRFDVIAKTDRGVPYEAIQVMLKNLLVERLKAYRPYRRSDSTGICPARW